MISNFEHLQRYDGRGICLYVREDFSYVNIHQGIFREALLADVTLPNGDVVSVGVIYRSPNSSQENNLKLLKLISYFARVSKSNMIIMGDFNFPRISWSDLHAPLHSIEEKFVEVTLDSFMFQVTEPTRCRDGQASNMLDLVFTKEEEYVDSICFSPPLGNSDHLILEVTVNQYLCDAPVRGNSRFLLNKGNYEGMREELKHVDWEGVLGLGDVNYSWLKFKSIILRLQTKFIPVAPPKINSKPLWMSKVAVSAQKAKSNAWKRYQFSKTKGNVCEYKKARNKFKSVLKQSRAALEQKIAEEIKEKPKSFWKYVRSKTKMVERLNRVRMHDGELSRSNEETASCLNSYFATVFTTESNILLPEFPCRTEERLDNITFQEECILDILKNLKVDKAPGPDGILPRVVSEVRGLISRPLKLIFDKSMESGRVPSEWKEATIIPIFKKGKKNMPQNYRPISITSVICKIMERIVRDTIMGHLEYCNLIANDQFGFVKGRSCTLQLLTCMEEWTNLLDKGSSVDVVYTDYSKAFDTVSHPKLLHKLKGLGIGNTILNWLKDFLEGRLQRVRVDDSYSHWEKVRSGVPQGSVLGPILFLVYINDLPEELKDSSLKLFADDAKIYKEDQTDRDAQDLQADLDRMTAWSRKWSLGLNTSKCKVLHVSRNQVNRLNYNITVGNQRCQLEESNSEKDLGVYVDERLTFETHIGKVINTANKVTGLIARQFKYLNKEVFLDLYKSLVRPHVEYSSVVWCPCTIRDRKLIEGIQRRATKMLPGMQNLSYDQRLRTMEIPSLQYRRLRADMIQVYKIIHGIDNIDPNTFFEMSNDKRTRGHKYKILKQRAKCNLRRLSFSHRIVDTWNALPENVVDAPDVNSFKGLLNTTWTNHPLKFKPSFY